MSLTIPYVPLAYPCDGSTRIFAVRWPFFDHDDLRVTHVSAAGVETPLDATAYRVRGGTNAGMPSVGTCETGSIYARDDTLRIERVTKITQAQAFAGSVFPPKQVEAAIDRVTMVLEEIAFGRAVATPSIVGPSGDGKAIKDARAALDMAAGMRSEIGGLRRLVEGIVGRQAAPPRPAASAPMLQPICPSPPPAPQEPTSSPAPRDDGPRTLTEAQERAFAALDRDADMVRARYVTPGKDYVYIQKQNEARATLDDTEPLSATAHPITGQPIVKYPHLEAMIGIYVPETDSREDDLRTAAVLVLGKAADFKAVSARIELALSHGKLAIAASETSEEAMSVPERLNWPAFIEALP